MKKNSPQIRFNGYEGEWEEVELENIAKIIDGDRGINYPSENDFSLEGHTIFLSATNVTKQGFSFSNVQYISEQKSNSMGKGKVSKNDLILTSRGSIGHIAYYDNEIFNQYPNLRINSGMLIIRVGKEHSGNFILQNLTSSKGSKNIKQISFGSAQPQLTKKDVSKLKLYKTNLSEQQAIGSFFKELDDIISLKKRELELLKEQKKGFLQKMFPKKGETVPEIRFAGFADDWEERKFKDIIEKLTGGASIKPSDYLEEGIRTIPKGAVNSTGLADLSGSKYISEEFYESNKSSHVSTNNLVTSLRDLVPSAPNMGRIVRIAGEDEDFLMPQGVYKLELFDGMDEEFLIAFSNSDKYRKIISSEKNGSTQVHIRNGEFLNIDIELPFSEEQKQIGSFFKQLDNSIALHQRKLDLLKETKKGFLQKMFV